MQRLTRWLDSLIPATLLEESSSWRARFPVHGVALGMVISAAAGTIYVIGGWWPGAVAVLAMVALLPLGVVMLRVRRSAPRTSASASCWWPSPSPR